MKILTKSLIKSIAHLQMTDRQFLLYKAELEDRGINLLHEKKMGLLNDEQRKERRLVFSDDTVAISRWLDDNFPNYRKSSFQLENITVKGLKGDPLIKTTARMIWEDHIYPDLNRIEADTVRELQAQVYKECRSKGDWIEGREKWCSEQTALNSPDVCLAMRMLGYSKYARSLQLFELNEQFAQLLDLRLRKVIPGDLLDEAKSFDTWEGINNWIDEIYFQGRIPNPYMDYLQQILWGYGVVPRSDPSKNIVGKALWYRQHVPETDEIFKRTLFEIKEEYIGWFLEKVKTEKDLQRKLRSVYEWRTTGHIARLGLSKRMERVCSGRLHRHYLRTKDRKDRMYVKAWTWLSSDTDLERGKLRDRVKRK